MPCGPDKQTRRYHTVQPGASSTLTGGTVVVDPGVPVAGLRRCRVRQVIATPGLATATEGLIAVQSSDASDVVTNELGTTRAPVFVFYHDGLVGSSVIDDNSVAFKLTNPGNSHNLFLQYSLNGGSTWSDFGVAAADNLTERVTIFLEYF